MDSTQGHIKGRARLTVPDDIVELAGVKLEKPKAGQVCWGIMEVKELFDTFQSALLLPEQYTMIGVFFDIALYSWVVVVESDAIPLPPKDQMIPVLMASYYRTEEGKVSLVDLQLMK